MYAVDQRAIRRIIAEENLKASNLAQELGISAKAVRNKINDPEGRLWKAHELSTLANLSRVEPGSFFTPSDVPDRNIS